MSQQICVCWFLSSKSVEIAGVSSEQEIYDKSPSSKGEQTTCLQIFGFPQWGGKILARKGLRNPLFPLLNWVYILACLTVRLCQSWIQLFSRYFLTSNDVSRALVDKYLEWLISTCCPDYLQCRVIIVHKPTRTSLNLQLRTPPLLFLVELPV